MVSFEQFFYKIQFMFWIKAIIKKYYYRTFMAARLDNPADLLAHKPYIANICSPTSVHIARGET